MADCDCKHKKKSGRILSDDEMVDEPLIAIAEDFPARTDFSVGSCGPCSLESGGSPSYLRFEKASRSSEGFAFETMQEFELPKKLAKSYARDRESPTCLPWVRVQRDPKNFRACLDQARKLGHMDNSKAIYNLVKEQLVKEDQEVFLVIMLDTQMQVRGITELARGARDSVQVPVPDTLRVVLLDGSSSFIVVHNHPSGVTRPSDADKELTKALGHAAKTVRIPLLDHLIVGADGYYSFNEHDLM